MNNNDYNTIKRLLTELYIPRTKIISDTTIKKINSTLIELINQLICPHNKT